MYKNRPHALTQIVAALKLMWRERDIPVFLPLLAGVLLLAGCTSVESLQSDRPSGEVEVDGDLEAWAGHLQSFEDGALSVGVLNDDEALYISARTSNPDLVREIMMRGLTLWIDPGGGTSENFGLNYPPGMPVDDAALQPGPVAADEVEMMREGFEASLQELEILVEGEPVRYVAENAPGIAIRADVDDVGTFTYELKLDLRPADAMSYAVDVDPGASVGIGFSTPQPDLSEMQEGQEGQEPQDGGRTPVDVRGGEMGGGQGMQSVDRRPSKMLDLWIEVTLAD